MHATLQGVVEYPLVDELRLGVRTLSRVRLGTRTWVPCTSIINIVFELQLQLAQLAPLG